MLSVLNSFFLANVAASIYFILQLSIPTFLFNRSEFCRILTTVPWRSGMSRFWVEISLGNTGLNKVILRQTSQCFQYADTEVNFQERNVAFMGLFFVFVFFFHLASEHLGLFLLLEGEESSQGNLFKFNSIYRLRKTINLSGTSSVNISKADKWIHCFIHTTNIYWALDYKRGTKALHSST